MVCLSFGFACFLQSFLFSFFFFFFFPFFSGQTKQKKKMGKARMVAGWVFLSIITNVAWVGSVIFMLPTLLVLPFSQPLYRALNDWLEKKKKLVEGGGEGEGKGGREGKGEMPNVFFFFFLRCAKRFFILSAFLLEYVIGVKFVITGDVPPSPVIFSFFFFFFLFFLFFFLFFFLLPPPLTKTPLPKYLPPHLPPERNNDFIIQPQNKNRLDFLVVFVCLSFQCLTHENCFEIPSEGSLSPPLFFFLSRSLSLSLPLFSIISV